MAKAPREMKKIIRSILWRLALKFRWRSKKYADWFSEEFHERIAKEIDDIELDVNDVTFINPP